MKRHRPVILLAALLVTGLVGGRSDAQGGESLFGVDSASVTYGPYARVELGHASPDPADGYWLTPGFPRDPRINFDVDLDNTEYGALAVGFDWQNGFRGEFALSGFGVSDITADCSSASDGSPCSTHADISEASVRTYTAMVNVYYAPLEAMGRNDRFQPFLVAGIGTARNEMSDWTRVNPGSGRPTRSFEGAKNTEFAWSLGAGVAYEIETRGAWPVILEAAYRYYDLGTAKGGSTPLPGNGNSRPVAPFQFENRAHVVSVGVRIPLQRY